MERTLFEKDNAGKAIVQVPEVHAADAALVVQLAVHVKRLVGPNLHLAHALARNRPFARSLAPARADAARAARGLVQRRVELVGPRRAVAVAVAVVVAEEVVAARLPAALDRQRLVDRREQVLGQVRRERDDGVEVVGGVLGVEAPEQVPWGKVTKLVSVKVSKGGWRWNSGGVGGLTGPNQRGRLPSW